MAIIRRAARAVTSILDKGNREGRDSAKEETK
jgi:hypothetical protein